MCGGKLRIAERSDQRHQAAQQPHGNERRAAVHVCRHQRRRFEDPDADHDTDHDGDAVEDREAGLRCGLLLVCH
jgi:hypothetical protein